MVQYGHLHAADCGSERDRHVHVPEPALRVSAIRAALRHAGNVDSERSAHDTSLCAAIDESANDPVNRPHRATLYTALTNSVRNANDTADARIYNTALHDPLFVHAQRTALRLAVVGEAERSAVGLSLRATHH